MVTKMVNPVDETGTVLNRTLLSLLLVVGITGCGGGGAGPSSPSPALPGTSTDALTTLHDEVRVKGLEERRFTQDIYWGVVGPVVEGSEAFRMEEVGVSGEGRPLRTITFGHGPVSVFLWSQMHGNESTATMALADLYNLVATHPDHPAVRTIMEGTTVHTLPMLNPDGAQRFQRRNAQGIDVNRDARSLTTPEGRVLKAVRDRVDPDFGFNLHDQGIGTRVGRTDRGASIALLSPPFDASRDINQDRRNAMEVMGVMIQAMEPLVGGHITKYDDTFNPRAFGDLITQWGTGTILVESGGWTDDPQKQYLRKVNFVGLVAALEAIATGSFRGVGVDLYAGLPGNGRRIADLLVRGGTVVIEGLPDFTADFVVSYDEPLLKTGGQITEIGDLGEVQAMDTLSLEGLFIHPLEEALEKDGKQVQIAPGLPAHFRVTRNRDGSSEVMSFRGGPPAETRRRD
jgi:hypothetical protein